MKGAKGRFREKKETKANKLKSKEGVVKKRTNHSNTRKAVQFDESSK
jgi:hypothetical protein